MKERKEFELTSNLRDVTRLRELDGLLLQPHSLSCPAPARWILHLSPGSPPKHGRQRPIRNAAAAGRQCPRRPGRPRSCSCAPPAQPPSAPSAPTTPGAAPVHAIPSVDFKAPEVAPLRDDNIDLNSNPISGPNLNPGSKKGGSQKEGESKKSTGSKMKEPKEEESGTKKKGKKKRKKRSSRVSSGSKEKAERIKNCPVFGFIASFILFCAGIGMAVFVAGHKWFGLKTIEAIAE